MNKLTRYFLGTFLIAGSLLASSFVQAQSATVTQVPITSMGTITEFSPQNIIIKSETGTSPVTYTYSKTTTYVDEAGNPVSMSMVKSGLPVTVYYTKTGETFAATKIVVRRSAPISTGAVIENKTSTTTTTSSGN